MRYDDLQMRRLKDDFALTNSLASDEALPSSSTLIDGVNGMDRASVLRNRHWHLFEHDAIVRPTDQAVERLPTTDLLHVGQTRHVG